RHGHTCHGAAVRDLAPGGARLGSPAKGVRPGRGRCLRLLPQGCDVAGPVRAGRVGVRVRPVHLAGRGGGRCVVRCRGQGAGTGPHADQLLPGQRRRAGELARAPGSDEAGPAPGPEDDRGRHRGPHRGDQVRPGRPSRTRLPGRALQGADGELDERRGDRRLVGGGAPSGGWRCPLPPKPASPPPRRPTTRSTPSSGRRCASTTAPPRPGATRCPATSPRTTSGSWPTGRWWAWAENRRTATRTPSRASTGPTCWSWLTRHATTIRRTY